MYQIFHCLQTYKFNHLCYNFYSKRNNSFENMCGRNFLAKRQSQEDKRESVKTCLITFLCLNDHPDYSPDDPSGILSQFFYIMSRKNTEIQIHYIGLYKPDFSNPMATLGRILAEKNIASKKSNRHQIAT